ncbi:MAG: GxGYxYP domain-containing protein [Bacteroidota bacterium]
MRRTFPLLIALLLVVGAVSVAAGKQVLIEPFDAEKGWKLEYFANGVSSFQTGDLSGNKLTIIDLDGRPVAKWQYAFTTSGPDAIQIHLDKQLEGETSTFGLFVYGDASGHILMYEVVDAEGEIFFTWFGPITWSGWKYVESDIELDRYAPGSASVGGNGEIDYPVRFFKLTLVDREPGFKGSGTLYLKDLQAKTRTDEPGPAAAGPPLQPQNTKEGALIVPGVFPRATPPDPTLVVYDNRSNDWEMQLALACMQGLVNREKPRLYFINYEEDNFWLSWLKERQYVKEVIREEDPWSLFRRFSDSYRGVVIADPALPASINVAAMLASVEDALAVTPRIYDVMTTWLGDLPIIEDLRGRWTSNASAYEWAFENLWPQMSHQALALMFPETSAQYPRDYLVQQRIFTLFVHGSKDTGPGVDPVKEKGLFDRILQETPPNIPLMGWPSYADRWGISEYEMLKWASRYGKFLPVTEFSSNLSVHSGYTVDPGVWKQPVFDREPPAYDPSKIYVAVSVLDSGDAAWYWQRRQLTVWDDPARGTIPIGWSLNPLMVELAPTVLEWYYQHLTDRDELYAAMSGIGYMFAPEYGTSLDNREAVLDAFLEETARQMDRLDLHAVAMHVGAWGEPAFHTELFKQYIDKLGNLTALLPGFGRQDDVTPDNANYLLNGVPVMHMQTRWMVGDISSRSAQNEIEFLVDSIKRMTKDKRPAFITAMALSWTVPPIAILRASQLLGDEYVFVTPSELARLFREAVQRGDIEM